MFLTRERILAN